ncbi:MAG: hypothetical protein ACXIUW_10355 [Roseinatronobacter sp.]
MRRIRYYLSRTVFSVSLVLMISGCSDFAGRSALSGSAENSGAVVMQGEIEDPDTFARRETGLWDGRPSLGGLWVAHPDALTPERVIIRNTENGQETSGALFRRERLNPGPSFQISAEAAAALSILAGAPTEIEVIALRQAQEGDAPPPEPEAAEDTGAQQTEDEDILPAASPAAPRGVFRRLFGQQQSALFQDPKQRDEIEIASIATGQGLNLAPERSLGFNATRREGQL